MRFTTWSSLTNAFIISTIALLSLIQAANAFMLLYMLEPNGYERPFLPGDLMKIRWYVPIPAGSKVSDDQYFRAVYNNSAVPDTTGTPHLMNSDFDYNCACCGIWFMPRSEADTEHDRRI